MKRSRCLALCALAVVAACNTKVTSTIDQDLENKVNTVKDCFPTLYPHASDLFEIANSWRQKLSSIADPAGLTWAEQGDGSIDVTFVAHGTTLSMSIVFYSPTGVSQDLDLTGATTLGDAVSAAADQLNTNFPSGDPFLVGAWTISGGGLSGSGALTGILGDNELLEIRTTDATVSGGPPSVAASTITDSGPPACTILFQTTSLSTDQAANQEYADGTVTFTVTGPDASVSGSITFDKTSTASITVTGINGSFALDLDDFTVTYVP